MPGTALHLLLVAAVVVCTHGDTLGDTTHCSAATDHDLGPGDVTAVLTLPQNSTGETYVAYVKPKEGFEGVSVKVEGDRNSEEEAWFPANETCLPANGSWWKVKVQVLHKTKTHELYFRLHFGKCLRFCSISESNITRTEGILVKAHGPSSWNTTLTNCAKALEPDDSYLSKVPCDKPPTRLQRPKGLSELAEVAVAAVAASLVVGLVMLVVAVMVIVSGNEVVI